MHYFAAPFNLASPLLATPISSPTAPFGSHTTQICAITVGGNFRPLLSSPKDFHNELSQLIHIICR
jgi:hypothetical protein